MSGLHCTNFGDTSRLRNLPTVVRMADARTLWLFRLSGSSAPIVAAIARALLTIIAIPSDLWWVSSSSSSSSISSSSFVGLCIPPATACLLCKVLVRLYVCLIALYQL